MSALFSPASLRGMTLANRIFVAPMCQYSAVNGLANAWHTTHLASLAQSGASLLSIEATAVEPDGRITPGCLGLWSDDTEAALHTIIATIRDQSSIKLALQLSHAGRKGSSHVPWEGGAQIPLAENGWQTHAPSALPHAAGEAPPIALDEHGLTRIHRAFADAAARAAQLGIDAIEIHAAHGYLLHEFLSPIANKRTDQYGGSLENRMRFPLEIFDAVRAAFPADKSVGVKVSATDWIQGGWDIDQTIAFAAALKQRGADWITASSAGISPLQEIPVGPGYQLPHARAIRQATGIDTVAIGLITEPHQAEEIIAEGHADFVALARAMLYDPRWGWHAAASLGAQVDATPQYWRAPPHDQKALFRNAAHGAR